MGIKRFAMGDTARKGNLRTQKACGGLSERFVCQGAGLRKVRWRVDRAIPKRAAISETVMSAGFEQGADGLDLFGREFGRATSLAAAGTGGFQAGDSSFADQVALELGQCGEDMKDQPTSRGAGLDLFGERLEVDFASLELRHEGNQVG